MLLSKEICGFIFFLHFNLAVYTNYDSRQLSLWTNMISDMFCKIIKIQILYGGGGGNNFLSKFQLPNQASLASWLFWRYKLVCDSCKKSDNYGEGYSAGKKNPRWKRLTDQPYQILLQKFFCFSSPHKFQNYWIRCKFQTSTLFCVHSKQALFFVFILVTFLMIVRWLLERQIFNFWIYITSENLPVLKVNEQLSIM